MRPSLKTLVLALSFIGIVTIAHAQSVDEVKDLETEIMKIKGNDAKDYTTKLGRYLETKGMGIMLQQGEPQQADPNLATSKKDNKKYYIEQEQQVNQIAICKKDMITENKSLEEQAKKSGAAGDAGFQKWGQSINEKMMAIAQKIQTDNPSMSDDDMEKEFTKQAQEISKAELAKLDDAKQKLYKGYQEESQKLQADREALSDKMKNSCVYLTSLDALTSAAGTDLDNLKQNFIEQNQLFLTSDKKGENPIYSFSQRSVRDLSACRAEAKKYCAKEENTVIECIDTLTDNAKEYPDDYKISASCNKAIEAKAEMEAAPTSAVK